MLLEQCLDYLSYGKTNEIIKCGNIRCFQRSTYNFQSWSDMLTSRVPFTFHWVLFILKDHIL